MQRSFRDIGPWTAAVLAGIVLACAGDEGATETGAPVTPDQLMVTVSPARDSVLLGTSKLFAASVTNQLGQPRSATVSWRSTNSEVLSMSGNGLATAFGTGSAQIIASIAGHADTAFIEVYGLTSSVHLVPEAVALAVGDGVRVLVTGDNVAGSGPATTWNSTDTSVALVSSDGTITGIAEGSVEITATVGTSSAKASVDVFSSPVASVTISPATTTVSAGASVGMDALARSATGALVPRRKPLWQSSDEGIATVTPNGRVTGIARGFATIRATVDGKSATATVNVTPPPVTTVTTSVSDASLVPGQVAQATATPYDARNKPISGLPVGWQSSNPGIATVNASGQVTAIASGTTAIAAIVGGQVGSVPVTVSKTTPTELAIAPDAPSIVAGSSTQLVAEIHDASGSRTASSGVVWASSNSAIVSVSQTGLIHGLAAGQADITATWNGITAAVPATVTTVAVATLSVSPSSATLNEGQGILLVAQLGDASGAPIEGGVVSWSSSAPGVAQVSVTGMVTAIRAGTATVTATSQGRSASATITVSAPAGPTIHQIDVTVNASALSIGQSTQAVATVRDINGEPIAGQTITWKSSEVTLATVSSTGLITALAPGSVSIIATSGDVSGAASITVGIPPVVPVETVSLRLSRDSVNAGDQAVATVTLLDAAGNTLTGRSLAFSSSRLSVATISTSGVITGVSDGTSTITASSGGKSASAAIRVIGGTPVVTRVQVNAPSILAVGDTSHASATAYDASGTPVSVSIAWTSSNGTVLSVNSVGKLTAIGAGNATLSARAASNGVTGTYGLTIQAGAPATVATVTVSLNNSSLSAGQTTQASVVLRDASGNTISGHPVTYSSSNTAVATVSATGLVTAVGTGSATISATSGGVSSSASLTVQSSTGPAVSSRIATRPTLPQNFVDVSWKPRTGATINVASGGNLQAALTNAQYGDEIVLAAGATFTGNFTLPVKSGTGWILVRTGGSIPALGQRMTPGTAGGVARIMTSNTLPALQTAPSTRGWRFVGIEFTAATNVTQMTAIVSLGDGSSIQNTMAKVPSDLVFDRVWVHGHATLNLRRCIALNSAATAVISSTIDECHDKGLDSQAIWGWNGPGPFLIENNYLEGSSENVGFGGGAPHILNLVPTDIIIRRNHIAKPATWKAAGWLVKNLMEFKNGRRILVEENLMEGNWLHGQQGYAIQLTPRSEGGACKAWCVIEDLTFRWNHIRRTGSGLNLSGRSDADLVKPSTRFLFENNLWEEINTGIYYGEGKIWNLANNGLADVTFSHNTGFGTAMTVLFCDAEAKIEIEDNVLSSTPGYGLWSCAGKQTGTQAISYHVQNWTYLRNITVNVNPTPQPTGNFYTTIAGTGFVDSNSRNWALSSSSPYKGRGENGKDPGVDFVTLISKLSGVVVP